MGLDKSELNEIIKVGAIGLLLWSFLTLFRLFPLDLTIIIPILIITLIYWLVEIVLIYHFDHFIISLTTIIVYTIFSALFLFIGQLNYLVKS